MKKLRKEISRHWYNGEWLDILQLSLDKLKNEPQYETIKSICELKWTKHKNDIYIAQKLYLAERQVRRLVYEVLMVGLAVGIMQGQIKL